MKNVNPIINFIKMDLSIIIISLFFLSFVSANNSGSPMPNRYQSDSITNNLTVEKIRITVGGVQQGMFIRTKNPNNPVLLYVHGGPAFPNYFLIDKYEPNLEEYFTVCYWEQRGGGLSYSLQVTLESMTFDQLVSDAIELTNFLRERYKQDKIYIMAHSGGTPIAIQAVYQCPELYNAYIAMAQITNQKESEKMAYRYMIEEYTKRGNLKMKHKLEQYHLLDSEQNIITFYRSVLRDKTMHQLGIGTMHKMNSIFWDIFMPVWFCDAYTFKEKRNIWKSKFSFLPKTNLFNELFQFDFPNHFTEIKVPIYFISGAYDLTVNINLAKAYYYKIKAPVKGFYTFKNSAHSPLYEEPQKFSEIIEKDVLNGTNKLSDN